MLRPYLFATAIISSTGLAIAAPVSSPLPDVQVRALRLTGTADNIVELPSLGGGHALILGGSGLSTPGESYIDAAVANYLGPLGYTGGASNSDAVSTPEGLYPFFGPFGKTLDSSVTQGAQTLADEVNARIAEGGVSADNLVVVFGYSQGADVETAAMQILSTQSDPVPADEVRFVMIGDPQNPDGGLLARYDLPGDPHTTISSLGLTFSGATPDNLYGTDIYTHEYDGFADFPKYPIDFLSDLNALVGILTEHTTYLGLTPSQLAGAIPLDTSGADTMTDYFMLPTTTLPLLAPLQVIPFVGQPLVDLLQPDLKILVDLGYGNLDSMDDIDTGVGGWDTGPADVATPLGFLPNTNLLEQVPQALLNGLEKGVTDAFHDLISPGNYEYSAPDWVDELIRFAGVLPGTQLSVISPVATTLQDLTGSFPPHTGLPLLDVATALLITLPELDYHEFTYELGQGNLLDAIGIPIAADLGIVPLALVGSVI